MKLTADNWDLLYKAHAFLQPFAGLTLCGEGAASSLSQVLRAMDALLKHYEQEKEIYSRTKTRDEKMLYSIEMGWYLLDKYYQKTDEALIYAAALLLDPRKRVAYLRQNQGCHELMHSYELNCGLFNMNECIFRIFIDNYTHCWGNSHLVLGGSAAYC